MYLDLVFILQSICRGYCKCRLSKSLHSLTTDFSIRRLSNVICDSTDRIQFQSKWLYFLSWNFEYFMSFMSTGGAVDNFRYHCYLRWFCFLCLCSRWGKLELFLSSLWYWYILGFIRTNLVSVACTGPEFLSHILIISSWFTFALLRNIFKRLPPRPDMGQVTKPTHGITTQCVNNLPSSGLEFFCAACSVNLAYGRVITASHLFPSASSLFIVRETHHTVHSLTPGHGRRYCSSFTPRAGSTQVTQEQLLCYLSSDDSDSTRCHQPQSHGGEDSLCVYLERGGEKNQRRQKWNLCWSVSFKIQLRDFSQSRCTNLFDVWLWAGCGHC